MYQSDLRHFRTYLKAIDRQIQCHVPGKAIPKKNCLSEPQLDTDESK